MAALPFVPSAAASTLQHRRIVPFDRGWRFQRGDLDGAQAPGYSDASWRVLDVPHDWGIEGPFSPDNPSGGAGGFSPAGIGWYRRSFRADQAGGDRLWTIEFDGVYENSTAWINGRELGTHRYGYSSFRYDLTPHVRSGENVVAVRVDNSRQPNCRWYSGSGIFRHVRLVQTDPLHVAGWGTYVTTPDVSSDDATVRVRTTVTNDGSSDVRCRLRTVVTDPDGKEAGEGESTANIPAGSDYEFDQMIRVPNPSLWSVETPVLYKARAEVFHDDRMVDDYETTFGIRTAVFDPRRGFVLNNKPVKFKGVCLHHDAGCLGSAVPVRAWERRFEALKAIGCNAIRTSHNPPAPEFLDLCDRMGFLVIDEAFDKYDFGDPHWQPIDWAEHWQQDLGAMLERDRNHPSVVLWSVGNESGQPGDERLNQRIAELVAFVHKEEPTRPATAALINVTERGVPVEQKISRVMSTAATMDILSTNYQEQFFDRYHELDPKKLLLSTEAFPYYRGGTDEVMRLHEQNPWYAVAEHDYTIGQFLWPGIDYLGESMGWPSKGWPTGLFDTCGFEKPMAGFHRAMWKADVPSVTMAVHHDGIDRDNGRAAWHWPRLARHWNFAGIDRDALEIRTFTNCETVEVRVGNFSYGVRRTADFPNNTIIWKVEYRARDGSRDRPQRRPGSGSGSTAERRRAGPGGSRAGPHPDRGRWRRLKLRRGSVGRQRRRAGAGCRPPHRVHRRRGGTAGGRRQRRPALPGAVPGTLSDDVLRPLGSGDPIARCSGRDPHQGAGAGPGGRGNRHPDGVNEAASFASGSSIRWRASQKPAHKSPFFARRTGIVFNVNFEGLSVFRSSLGSIGVEIDASARGRTL